MKANRYYSAVDDALTLPKLIKIKDNMYAACFTLMKLLPAKYILDTALKDGRIGKHTTIIESTSGTFGLALAILCNQRGLKLILVSDQAVDHTLKRRMEELGATVDICMTPEKVGGIQQARLNRLAEYKRNIGDHFWPSQYTNKKNPGAYALFSEFLLSRIGLVDCVVGSVGSGGSMCGTLEYLRSVKPDCYAVGVDTHGSILFGLNDSRRVIRGLGNSIMPPNLDHTCFDEIHWLNAKEIICATRQLHRKHALYLGPTSGAAYAAAEYIAKQHPKMKVVFICADEGYRYADNVYNDRWLIENNLLMEQLNYGPTRISHSSEINSRWCRIQWNRNSLEEMLAHNTEEAISV